MTGPAAAATPELVVLLDEEGRATGTVPKAEVHHRDTPLHLAFSCYLFAEAPAEPPQMLLTRRAATKRTWPGVWTNACCGHPAPGEPLLDAVVRRVRQELGVGVAGLRPVLPSFRYRAVMADGTVENEMCPVLVGTCPAREAPDPDPAEVDAVEWVDWVTFRDDVRDGRREVSPWCEQQVAALPADPLRAPVATAGLPPAVRL